ncbi:MAG: aldehyde dehydrogenase family protein [Melioribacteraceae bacterium]|nr:aldehyde dehydrogenase family protein [Melioribacteraceae bacterium]
MQIDKDIQSRQEARDLCAKAKEAQLEFKHYNQEQVDKIIKSMVDAGMRESERLAKMALEETGFGKWEDKLIKNQFATRDVYNHIKDLKTVGVIETRSNGKIVRIAEPMGVVAAIIPSTNPTSTAMFKSIISLKCRNTIVASPHPKAVNCTLEALKVMSEAAVSAGAPKNLILGMTIPTLEGTEALMKEDNVAIILATGSNPMVKAAYSAGKPAYGVGSGNVPSYIDRSANYKKAVSDIIKGTTFDNGTLCSSEQAMIVDRPLAEKVIAESKSKGIYFVTSEEKRKLENAVTKGGKLNAEIVGKSAEFIAEYAGIKVPAGTKVLAAECTTVGHDELLSMEKLSPMLAFYVVDGWLDGCHKCIELLKFGGIGHTLSIHANDQDIIMKFALEKPAFRIVVNTPSSLGAVGYTTDLAPTLTIGVGTWGGSIISENVSAVHLMNVKTLAYETKPINEGNSVSSLKHVSSSSGFMETIEERLRARAGNPVIKEKTNQPQEKIVPKDKSAVFGSGISKGEINKIISEFKH